MLREGYCLPFLSTPPLSNVPIPLPSYSPTSIKGAALEEVTLGLIAKGAVELAPFPFSWLLLPSVRSVEDLGVLASSHRPFPSQSLCGRVPLSDGDHSVCAPVCTPGGDWMASIDLKEAYFQVPVHPASRHFLRFVVRGTVYQFKALCFGLSTAPQVFTRVMAPVSAILHSLGIHMRRYLGRLAGPVFLSGVSPRGSSDCPPSLSRIGDCYQSHENQPRTFPGSSVSRGRYRLHLFQGFSVGGTHRAGCSQQPPHFSPAPRLPRACGCRFSACFLRWLTSFLAADCG